MANKMDKNKILISKLFKFIVHLFPILLPKNHHFHFKTFQVYSSSVIQYMKMMTLTYFKTFQVYSSFYMQVESKKYDLQFQNFSSL